MSYNSISCDCKIYMNYMKQKSVDVDMTAATKADVKFIHLHNYGGSADFSLLEGYPNLGFAPKIFTVDGHIDERISSLFLVSPFGRGRGRGGRIVKSCPPFSTGKCATLGLLLYKFNVSRGWIICGAFVGI